MEDKNRMNELFQDEDGEGANLHNQESEEEELSLGNEYTGGWSSKSILDTLDIAFRNQLTEDSERVQQPKQILVPLRNHQRALIYAMQQKEQNSIRGVKYMNTTTYTNYGVLGDDVGSGKSLVILSHIALLKEVANHTQKRNILYPQSRLNLFTVYTKQYKNLMNASLIVVPHTIYKQWQDYCKKQTSLDVFYVKSKSDIEGALINSSYVDVSGQELQDKLIDKIRSSDIVLVSNTLYKELYSFTRMKNLSWKRVFIDEVDSIHITSTSPVPDAPFVWFISATWANFIMERHSISPHNLQYFQNNTTTYCKELGDWIRSEVGLREYTGGYQGRTSFMRIRSAKWLETYSSEHKLRGMVLLMCRKDFLEESRRMPHIYESTILCEQPESHRLLYGLVNKHIQNMLHAGNVEGVLHELGVNKETPIGLLEAVRQEREKELDRLQKTLKFKETIEYATPNAKEAALTSLRDKIHSVEEQLKTFENRISNIKSVECPVCYEDPTQNSATMTPCCQQIFCGICILTSLTRNLTCPMCRAAIHTNQLVQIVDATAVKKKKESVKLLSKPKQLLKILIENPSAKVLVFSRYENPFLSLEKDCDMHGVTYHTLRGNKDTIASTIRSFEKGEKRVLFLPTSSVGAGINLVSATHIVLLHAMTPEEEKQAVGRAYRLGRTEPLHVIKLQHESEEVYGM
jgi:SNF2 family DNA or RNA helicase